MNIDDLLSLVILVEIDFCVVIIATMIFITVIRATLLLINFILTHTDSISPDHYHCYSKLTTGNSKYGQIRSQYLCIALI